MAFDNYYDDLECESCCRVFNTYRGRFDHMKALNHFSTYCLDCDRNFMNNNNLNQHLNSRIHRGSTIKCPFCKRGYTTASGVSHHLENGSCPNAPSLDRETLHRMIRRRDPNGVITQKQLGWHDDTSASTVVGWQLDNAWNGDNYECFLCHREFGIPSSLRQHLESPAHARKLYHFPNRRCNKDFAGLGMLFNHLESESCKFVKFDAVQRNVGGILTGQRLIAFG
ncbi:putative zinc finger protein [Phyllosticta citriasiana]|uniref:putative zinc finger protein n=1 Tax=Phyllosticta citriasiana TaxID=595635 RepID=UPI0030FDEEF4